MGGTVLEGRFRTLHTIYHFSIAALQSGFDVLATANDFASRPGVNWAEPSFIYLNPQPASTCIPLSPSPTSSELSKNWWDDGTWGINVSGAWAECGGESAPGQPVVRVGVIGDGVDLTHPDLYKLGATIPGKGFVSAQPSAASGEPWDVDCDLHETQVAGMIAMIAGGGGSASLSGVGAAPRIEIVSARTQWTDWVFSPPRCFGQPVPASEIRQGFEWLVDPPSLGGAGVRVINYSWAVGPSGDMDAAIADALEKDVVVVVPVGNGDQGTANAYPSTLSGVLSVGGIDSTGQRWRDNHPDVQLNSNTFWGSNFAPNVRYVAPAKDLYTTDRPGAFGENEAASPSGDWNNLFDGAWHDQPLSGTSFASPLVAGVAALVRAARPDLNRIDVDRILCQTAKGVPNWDRIDDTRNEGQPICGLIDATAAILAAKSLLFTSGFETGDFTGWTGATP